MTRVFSRSTWLTALGTAALLFSAGGASAAICTATYTATTPDPAATLTNATSCGAGTLDANDNDARVRAAEPSAALWTQIDKDEGAGSGATGVLRSTGTNPAGSSGSWGIDTAATAFNSFLIVIKDGNAGSPTAPVPTWYWFVIDKAAGCTIGSFSGSLTYCGTWTMYGEAGKIKDISHLSLYGATVASSSGTPGTATPAPGSVSMALLGLALLGGSFVVRRRRESN